MKSYILSIIIFNIILCNLLFSQESTKLVIPNSSENIFGNINYKIVNDSISYLFVDDNLYITKDDGITYEFRNKVVPFEKVEMYNNLFVSINMAACCVYYFFSTDFGNSWIENDSIQNYNLSFVNDTLIYGIYSDEDVPILYSSSDFGFNWKKIKTFKNNEIVNGVYFINPKIGFCFGKFLNKTTDYGKTWTKSNSLNYNYIHDFKFIDEQNGFLYGFDSSRNGKFLKTKDGGNTWTLIKNIEPNISFEFIFVSPEIGWIIEDSKLIGLTIDGGISFQYLDYLTDESIKSIECKKDGTSFVITSNGIFKTTLSNHFISENEIKNKYYYQINKKEKNAKAIENYNSENWLDAYSLYKELIEVDSLQSPDNLFNMGWCCFKLEKYSDGILYFRKVIEIEPNNYDANNNLGVCFERTGNYEEAKKYYEFAILIDPRESLAVNNLKLVNKKLYNASREDINVLNTYFSLNNPGSYFIYLCDNNSAPIQKELIVDIDNKNIIRHSIREYYRSTPYYQVGRYWLQEERKYTLAGSEFICEYKNPRIGEYSNIIFSFPLVIGSKWKNILGFDVSVVKFNATVSTIAGTFTNCLMIGNAISSYYYAPGVGLVLLQSYNQYGELINLEELIDYSLK